MSIEARYNSKTVSQPSPAAQAQHQSNKHLYLYVLITGLFLALVGSANASVAINSPSNGSSVSGTVTVKAQITDAWWSKLWVDGKGISAASVGLISFKWNSGSVSDGSHRLTVYAYPSGGGSP